MMKKPGTITRQWVGIPPWVIIGAVLVLLPIFVFMTMASINRKREDTTKMMLEKGAALIRSFEAGARTGMMGMMGMHRSGFQLQDLLSQTAQQPDILYLLVTDTKGRILAHNDPAKRGETYGEDLDLEAIAHSKNLRWREVRGPSQTPIFEVFRQFSPVHKSPGRHHGMMMRFPGNQALSPSDDAQLGEVIFVGLDMAPVEAARRQDTRHTVMMAVILLLIGFAGMFSLFLAQAYQSTKGTLAKVKAFSESIVRNMPIGLIAVDAEGGIVSFNQTAHAILRLAPGDVLGKSPQDILPKGLCGVLDEMHSDGNVIEREIACPTMEGRVVPLEVIGTAIYEESGLLLSYIVLFRDLTQIQALKAEVARTQRLASIGSLAAGIAHELRNPLSSVKGLATYFKERYSTVPEDKKTAEIMIQEVDRLNRVITQLLEFARPLSIEKKPVSMENLIQHSLRLIEGDVHKKGVKISRNIQPGIDKVNVDPDRFKQVLLNIYINAIEAMDQKGSLSVELMRHPVSGDVQIIVTDNGAGIKKEDLPHIFDPYFTSKPSGTGLGLAIVHKIIESHGAKVSVESTYQRGTTVTITLPSSMEG